MRPRRSPLAVVVSAGVVVVAVVASAAGCGKRKGAEPSHRCGEVGGWHACVDGVLQDGDHVRVSFTLTQPGATAGATDLEFALWTADRQRQQIDHEASQDLAYAGHDTCDRLVPTAKEATCVAVFRAPHGVDGMHAEVSDYEGHQARLSLRPGAR